jgi:hypothetical protein
MALIDTALDNRTLAQAPAANNHTRKISQHYIPYRSTHQQAAFCPAPIIRKHISQVVRQRDESGYQFSPVPRLGLSKQCQRTVSVLKSTPKHQALTLNDQRRKGPRLVQSLHALHINTGCLSLRWLVYASSCAR